jgi:hypothetical protein
MTCGSVTAPPLNDLPYQLDPALLALEQPRQRILMADAVGLGKTIEMGTLIMASATPHDGKAASFASLMNMLNPTAIADPDNYGPDDIKGLFLRRYKKHNQEQVAWFLS